MLELQTPMTRKAFWAYFDRVRDDDAERMRLHRAYWGQFVTEGMRDRVWDAMGKRLTKSNDPHFNDTTSVRQWDRLAFLVPRHPQVRSRSDFVCVLKEAARQALAERTP